MFAPIFREIWLFSGITLSVSWLCQWLMLSHGGVKQFGIPGLVAIMWIPGLVAILYRIVSRIGFSDAGFKKFDLRFSLVALGVPFIFALVTSAICAFLDMREFAPLPREHWGPALPKILTILAFGFLGALGEEIGWRGFLVSRMQKLGFPHFMLWSGIIWALWHLPLVALGDYYETKNPALIAILYTISILTFNYFISWMFLKTKSLWIATLTHTFHNFFFQFFFPALFFTAPGLKAHWWETVGGDSGLLPIILYGLLALALGKSARRKSFA